MTEQSGQVLANRPNPSMSEPKRIAKMEGRGALSPLFQHSWRVKSISNTRVTSVTANGDDYHSFPACEDLDYSRTTRVARMMNG
jgi:hypothetical protein